MKWCSARNAIIADKGKKMITYTEEKKFTKTAGTAVVSVGELDVR